MDEALVRRIDAALPQTQCQRCSYPDCESYARAIAAGEAGINQCPPGGQAGVERLARITGLPAQPIDPRFGIEGPVTVAVIDEDWCIGCTLCIKVCPTDAIVGLNKRMHTVIEPYCTGCELCIPVCPVDCIHPRKDEAEFASTRMLYIHPEECIDCGACVPACPVGAIYAPENIPDGQSDFIAINASLSASWPLITEQKEPMEAADSWRGQGSKRSQLIA